MWISILRKVYVYIYISIFKISGESSKKFNSQLWPDRPVSTVCCTGFGVSSGPFLLGGW